MAQGGIFADVISGIKRFCTAWIYFHVPILFPPDYPYCLSGKELKGVIKGLIGRCSDILPDFFDHCVYTMLREMDRQTGKYGARYLKMLLKPRPFRSEEMRMKCFFLFFIFYLKDRH